MTIDEAILNHKRYSDLARERKKGIRNQDVIKMQSELEIYHKQIAEWLEELKELRNDKQIIHAPNCGLFIPLEEVKAMQMNFAMERQRLLEENEQLRNQQEKDVISYDEAYMRGYKSGKIEGMIKGLAKGWISCKKEMPKDLEIVNIVWVNHNPTPYYMDIKDKPFVATGIYCRGQWYWYSITTIDRLEEYGKADFDLVHKDVEITHWQPLPEPPQGESKND